jgi:UDP-N-acetyl-D-glucosamine dehydrogenase
MSSRWLIDEDMAEEREAAEASVETYYLKNPPVTLGQVAVVGLGYVGWPLAKLASRNNYQVNGIDVDARKLDLYRGNHDNIELSPDFYQISECSIIIICVPTPVNPDNTPDLSLVESASSSVACFMKRGQLVILESTVSPGVSNGLVRSILEDISGLECGKDFHLAHCPERINPGDSNWDVENIPRVVGATHDAGLGMAIDFYQSILKAEVRPMGSIEEAEAVKIVENSFRDLNIAFANELAMSFSMLGIDVVNVIEGAATKPFGFMPHQPGCGIGGHCIPVDPYYLIHYAKDNGFNHELLSMARRINSRMPEYVIQLLSSALGEEGKSLEKVKVAVLGLAYKPGIEDCRESPAFKIIGLLENRGAEVIKFDPHVYEKSDVGSMDQALEGSDAAIIVTAHDLFRRIAPSDLLEHGVSTIIDGRNCLPKELFVDAGINYRGIGR